MKILKIVVLTLCIPMMAHALGCEPGYKYPEEDKAIKESRASHGKKVGDKQWCSVNNNNGTVQCNYDTYDDCETYRTADEKCEKNPEPGKQY